MRKGLYDICKAHIIVHICFRNFGGEYAVVNSPPEFAGMTHDDVMKDKVRWEDPNNQDMYRQIQKWGPIRALCQNADGSWNVNI